MKDVGLFIAMLSLSLLGFFAGSMTFAIFRNKNKCSKNGVICKRCDKKTPLAKISKHQGHIFWKCPCGKTNFID